LKAKLIRITTIPASLKVLLKGQNQFMSDYFEVIGVSSPEKELGEIRETESIKVFPIEMSRKITPIQDIRSLICMYQFLKKEKPQIVHTHTPKAGIIGMLAAKFTKVPYRLHTVAGMPLMEAKGLKRKILDVVEKLTYLSATHIYPNSKGLYNFILQNKYTVKEKLKVIGNGSSNGIDTAFFSPDQISEDQKNRIKKQLNIIETDFVFIFIGRLVGDKGINELVKAFALICKSHDLSHSPKLLLVGPQEPDLDPLSAETLKEIDNNPNIINVGFQEDVRPYFSIANLLVFPSYREGFPNVVMQSGSMGLPSIVSDINGCNEIIIQNKNGVIVPSKNIDRLFQAMEELMLDTHYYTTLKSQARPMIQSRYEQSVIWKELLAEYQFLLRE
jgi:glycosyltransferase involved in cell wall biosynthesis